MISRTLEKFCGLFIAIIGMTFTFWNWYLALHKGYFYLKLSFLGPCFFVFGVALILFPSYSQERIDRGEDITKLQGLALLTPRWWAVLVVGSVIGIGNSCIMRFMLFL